MGYLTRAQIVSRGLRDAAVSDTLETVANEWLNTWLRSQYLSWPWPFLRRKATAISWTSGTASKTVGAGNSSITVWIKEIYEPLYFFNSAYSKLSEAAFYSLDYQPSSDRSDVNDPARIKGIPDKIFPYMHESTQGAWVLYPNLIPNQDMLLVFDYWALPLDMNTGSGDDAVQPPYPNDATMIQAIKAKAMEDDRRGDEANAAYAMLSTMLQDDRIRVGNAPGQNREWGLDPTVYRRSG